jgi:hypothetical protein
MVRLIVEFSPTDGPEDGGKLSHPVLRPKPDAHHMYAQDQVVIHMTRM